MKEIIKKAEDQMKKAISSLEHQYSLIRAGRANPAIIDGVMVDYYGTPTPINQVGSVSVAEARILVIQPWEKNILGDIEKALQKADLGINPTNDGNAIRLAFPQPTEERRKELVKEVKSIAEECKVVVRNARRDANDTLKAMKDVSEDDVTRSEKEVQTLTDSYTKKIDDVSAAKEKEVLEI